MTNTINTSAQKSWRTTLSNALIITRREVRDSMRDWRIIAPIILLTFFFPLLAQFAATGIAGFLAQYGEEAVGEQFIPLMLMIVGFFPISISLVIALETFVGEKERLSLEPLLSTPLTNTELYIGKTLASMIPPLTASFGGMTFYIITLYVGNAPWIPPFMIALQMYVLTIVQALVMVTGAVVVSSQATTTRSANLLASFIIIPMTLIINAEAIIILLAPDARSETGISALWAIALAMIIVTILLLRVGNSIFNREDLLGRMIDSFNLRGFFSKIWLYIRAYDDQETPAKNIFEWYTKSIPYSLGKIRTAMAITTVIFIVYFIIGMWIGTLADFQIPIESADNQLETISATSLSATTENLSIMGIFSNNVRVLAFAFVLSLISFGVAGYIIVPIVFIVLGYIAVQLFSAGYGTLYLTGVLPHGIIEIPIILIATAAMFYVGAIITKPPSNETVGYAWMTALGSAIKLWLGVVLPGLLIAAIIESTLTISLVQQVIESQF